MQLMGFLKNEVHKRNAYLVSFFESGSSFYGWRSQDSDYDIRGIFKHKKETLLGINRPIDTIDFKKLKIEGLEDFDIVLFEIGKVAYLALKGNCNMIEELSANQMFAEPDFLDLQELLLNSWGKRGAFGSYNGLATRNYKKFILGKKKEDREHPEYRSVKKYLYVYRGLLAGRYLLDNEVMEQDMEKLAKYYRVSEAKELLKLKRKGKEKEQLENLRVDDDGRFDRGLYEQWTKLDESYQKSERKEFPTDEDIKAVNDLLVKIRLST